MARTFTVAVALALWLVVGCVSTPKAAEGPLPGPPRLEGDPSAEWIYEIEPEFLAIETGDSIPGIGILFERLSARPDRDEAPVRYLRARLLLAQAIVSKFHYDHVGSGDPPWKEIDAWVEQGLVLIDAALKDKPNESDYHRVKAELHAMLVRSLGSGMRHGPALSSALNRSLELDPENPFAHMALGKRYFFAPPMLGRDMKQARAAFERARDLASELGDTWLYLGSYHEEQGEAEAARKCLERCLELQPGRPMAKKILELLPSAK